ncbi:hypothetical protein [Natronobacterium texcoconense]|uniref:Uncharacterized protein n=1 Tax=Natronobacterium texcoconense TaxID=1095778 RepID=A0A1H1I1B1_NATTX|nr:hypothetical protein [Natronobacterium texcoconense]SDR31452.1 hypothetical protein SAMN04489842_3226 [Natronobacterium texcoconense]
MTRITRRRALQFGSVTLGAVVAGCSSLGVGAAESTRLTGIRIKNRDPTSRAVHVLILDGDDPVYWGSEVADAYSVGEDRRDEADFEGVPTELGTHVLYAWRDDQPRDEWERFDFGDYEPSCGQLVIGIGYTDDDQGELTIMTADECPRDDHER